MNADRDFELLVQRYIDGLVSAEEIERLNERLRGDADARREFIELLNLDSALAIAAESVDEFLAQTSVRNSGERGGTGRVRLPVNFPRNQGADAPRSPSRLGGLRAVGRWFATAACLALIASGVWWRQASSRVWATVHTGIGVAELADGTALRNERHEIKAGMVELVTARGARVVIEAPAEFRFESEQRLRLARGRLAADVPPSAKGFTVVTPSGDAIDLGTQFGVDVPVIGAAEIHVFRGEVIAKASGAKARQSLRGGEALTMDRGASIARELRPSFSRMKCRNSRLVWRSVSGHEPKRR